MDKGHFKSVNAYIAAQPRPARDVLERVRRAIRKALPGAEETISYNIPAYRLHGRGVVYFAGWKRHFSLYPATARVAEAFAEALAPYEVNGKGTVRFPLSEPVPVRLIEGIAKFRAREVAEGERAKAKAPKKRR